MSDPKVGDKPSPADDMKLKYDEIADRIGSLEKLVKLQESVKPAVTQKEHIQMSLQEFYRSDMAIKTVKELLTSTTNLNLSTLVIDRAFLVMLSKLDFRPYLTRTRVPSGAGRTFYYQIITQTDYSDWTQGSALAAADPSLSSVNGSVTEFGKVTQVSDILKNVSAINFVEEVGRVHGGCVLQGIVDKTVDALNAATTNEVEIGVKADSTEASFTFANVDSAIGKIKDSGFEPTWLFSMPAKLWTAFTTSYAVTQFYGALNDYFQSGQIPRILGLNWVSDSYFEKGINAGAAWNGTNGETYALVGGAESGVWGELETDPTTELYRVPTELSSYVITHLAAGVCKAVDASICRIEHAD